MSSNLMIRGLQHMRLLIAPMHQHPVELQNVTWTKSGDNAGTGCNIITRTVDATATSDAGALRCRLRIGVTAVFASSSCTRSSCQRLSSRSRASCSRLARSSASCRRRSCKHGSCEHAGMERGTEMLLPHVPHTMTSWQAAPAHAILHRHILGLLPLLRRIHS